MGRIWNWDFEEQRPPRRVRAPRVRRPTVPAHVAQVRRRRAGALAVVAVVLVVALVAFALAGAHRGHPATEARSAVGAQRVRSSGPPSDPESDGRSAVASVLAYTPFVREGGGGAREVALTFDDGPGPYTPGVLGVLERFHVHATFFAIGRMERYFGASTVKEIEDGDVVGDHTEDHPMLAQLSAHDQREQLFEQIIRVELLGGKRPDLFRPPYGSFNATTMQELRSLHLLMVLWSTDTGDYQQPGVAAIVERALAGAHPGAIILMHDGGGTRTETIEALPEIIERLRARGYRLVTVPQLLADDPPPAGQPLPSSLAGD